MDDSPGADYTSADYVTLFSELFRRTSDPVFMVRLADGAIIDANGSLLRLIEYERAHVIRHSMLGTPTWATPSSWWATLLADLRARGRIEDRPVVLRASSDREHDISLTAVVARWRGEDIAMVIGRLSRSP